ncbi:hypothetical protein BT69DRAFT_132469 [Atractiella rhizophila]|nr:hypothetical protein BT69DRAFT_132469 [Atractiella rhizophila]
MRKPWNNEHELIVHILNPSSQKQSIIGYIVFEEPILTSFLSNSVQKTLEPSTVEVQPATTIHGLLRTTRCHIFEEILFSSRFFLLTYFLRVGVLLEFVCHIFLRYINRVKVRQKHVVMISLFPLN